MKEFWSYDIDYILNKLETSTHYSELYEEFSKVSGKAMTKNLKASIRAVIEKHSSDSTQFNGKKDLFYSVNGLGNGTWGLRSHKIK
ncbi:hypothetical protein [Peptoniphilus obesi]|uniref:hypothetical protein n=1 Tax=Peptoniphilus obesi TaxID=1472765 RepID=UPI0004B08C41|nr:hypothetical protein [Peptoniphilus obesi]